MVSSLVHWCSYRVWVSSSYVVAHKQNSSSMGNLVSSSDRPPPHPPWTPGTHVVHIQTHTENNKTNLLKLPQEDSLNRAQPSLGLRLFPIFSPFAFSTSLPQSFQRGIPLFPKSPWSLPVAQNHRQPPFPALCGDLRWCPFSTLLPMCWFS